MSTLSPPMLHRPPEEWCAELNPEQTHICDQPRGHEGDHRGPELPTVQIDESAWDELEDARPEHVHTPEGDAARAALQAGAGDE